MNDDRIPVLEDLISPGHGSKESGGHVEDANPSGNVAERHAEHNAASHADFHNPTNTSDEIDANPSTQELIVDEEIRQILEKHMDNAYQEIIRLLNHRIR